MKTIKGHDGTTIGPTVTKFDGGMNRNFTLTGHLVLGGPMKGQFAAQVSDSRLFYGSTPVKAIRAAYAEMIRRGWTERKTAKVGDRVTLPEYTGGPGEGKNYGAIKGAEIAKITPQYVTVRRINTGADATMFGAESSVRLPRSVVEDSRTTIKPAKS